jgi:hypothetical protein
MTGIDNRKQQQTHKKKDLSMAVSVSKMLLLRNIQTSMESVKLVASGLLRILIALILPLSLALPSSAQSARAPKSPQAQKSAHPSTQPDLASANTRPRANDARDLAAPFHPFPQHNAYQPNTILPNHISQEEMDDSVTAFYRAWKKHYVVPSARPDESYILFEGTKGSNICVSEGQGYGMVIVALMAGFDSSAQETYDCLYRWFKSHPSTTSPHLMAWTQMKDGISLEGGAATDGDMDIAYSLLLADAQWGRHSNVPYRQEALAMIDAIRHQEINPYTYVVMEDNTNKPRNKDDYDMRSSD